jgi:hypothetical protein
MSVGSRARPVRRADNLTAVYEPIVWTMGSLTSHSPVGLRSLLRGYLYFLLFNGNMQDSLEQLSRYSYGLWATRSEFHSSRDKRFHLHSVHTGSGTR